MQSTGEARQAEQKETSTILRITRRACARLTLSLHLVLLCAVLSILLLFDANKLDISDEFKNAIEASAHTAPQNPSLSQPASVASTTYDTSTF